MVGNNVESVLRAFEVMLPHLEALENGEELFVMRVIIALGFSEGAGMEGYGMDLAIRRDGGDDAGEGIVGGVSLDKQGFVRGPMGKDRGFCKRLL